MTNPVPHMRPDAIRVVLRLVIAVATIWPVQGWSKSPCSTAPVIAKPFNFGGSAQFASQVPAPGPTFTAPYRWMLVDDFTEGSAGGQITSGFVNTTPNAVKTELFAVRNPDMEGVTMQFAKCTVRAHLAAAAVGSTTVYLVVAGNDGGAVGAITVAGTTLQERTRSLTVNPATGSAWTANDLYQGTTIGVKNAIGNPGVGIESIVLECEPLP